MYSENELKETPEGKLKEFTSEIEREILNRFSLEEQNIFLHNLRARLQEIRIKELEVLKATLKSLMD